ncbi:RcnB family protein [Novosphingobium sp. SL115]|uniref:RcnB family protein n=1 Tax=Novosphingobium sp. SL115 TaxID=2995150 RepID=UPI0022762AE9|nr:RcnB family protein [Novosphingobium sp. SL115]MCY1672162.1 RcnB family protein [Novosphingobium sp. SL115]
MKKLFAAIVAIAMIAPVAAAPALAAPHKDKDNHGQHVSTAAKGNPFRKGQKFDSRRAPNYRVVDYRSYRTLKAPPKGHRYVRSGNDILLVRTDSGIVSSIFSGLIR